MDVTIHCNKDLDKNSPVFELVSHDHGDSEHIVIKGTAKQACALFSLSYFFGKYPVPFAIAFMLSGLIIAFLGFRIFNVVLFLMAAFIVGFIIFNLVYQLAASSITMEKAWVVWIILGAATLVGLIVGVFAVKYQRYCFLLAGACLGGIIGFLVFTAFLSGSLKIVFVSIRA